MRNLLIPGKYSLNFLVCFQSLIHSPLKSCLCFKCPRLKKRYAEKNLKKVPHIKSRGKMKNENSC